jgi:hypothetical protein
MTCKGICIHHKASCSYAAGNKRCQICNLFMQEQNFGDLNVSLLSASVNNNNLQIVMLTVAVTAIYEFIYNLLLWNSFATISLLKDFYKPNNLSMPYPDPKTPWNLAFATQMTLAGFLISAHRFYIISRNITQNQDKYNWK